MEDVGPLNNRGWGTNAEGSLWNGALHLWRGGPLVCGGRPLVCVHYGPVVDFFITKQTSLHPFDFVRNLFHLLVCILFS